MNRKMALAVLLVAGLPAMAAAQSGQHSSQHSGHGFGSSIGPSVGDREFSISGTGSSDRKFDSTSFGVTGDVGWYLRDEMVLGVRQSINYASIEGENLTNDFWNGATRGYLNYHFGSASARPFIGASLGLVYGDGVNNSGFGGLEGGIKHYVLPSTYILGRIEYQWFFESSSDVNDNFSDGAWAYTVGLGYNF